MKILITGPGEYLCESPDDKPKEGVSYFLEDATSGTAAQGKAFHALIQEYYRSGAWSYRAGSFAEFKDRIKQSLGAGYESFVYAVIIDGKAVVLKANTLEEIPAEIRSDPDYLKMVRGKLKSWTDYTKKERKQTIDNVISEMHQVGINSKKFNEILSGMEGIWKEKK